MELLLPQPQRCCCSYLHVHCVADPSFSLLVSQPTTQQFLLTGAPTETVWERRSGTGPEEEDEEAACAALCAATEAGGGGFMMICG